MTRLRSLIQTLMALGTNAYLLFPFGGAVIYQGPLKAVCHPGLNCYSCPGALLSCPVGAFQNFMGSLRFSTGGFPFTGAIVVGYLGFIATAVGLFAAIPAVIAYNWFLSKINVLRSEMESFSSDFLNIVKRHFFK